jgi:hypothetical protein
MKVQRTFSAQSIRTSVPYKLDERMMTSCTSQEMFFVSDIVPNRATVEIHAKHLVSQHPYAKAAPGYRSFPINDDQDSKTFVPQPLYGKFTEEHPTAQETETI